MMSLIMWLEIMRAIDCHKDAMLRWANQGQGADCVKLAHALVLSIINREGTKRLD